MRRLSRYPSCFAHLSVIKNQAGHYATFAWTAFCSKQTLPYCRVQIDLVHDTARFETRDGGGVKRESNVASLNGEKHACTRFTLLIFS